MPSSRAQADAAVRAGPSSGSAEARSASGGPRTVHFSGQQHQLGSLRGGPANQALGDLEIPVVLVGGVELYGCGAHSVD